MEAAPLARILAPTQPEAPPEPPGPGGCTEDHLGGGSPCQVQFILNRTQRTAVRLGNPTPAVYALAGVRLRPSQQRKPWPWPGRLSALSFQGPASSHASFAHYCSVLGRESANGSPGAAEGRCSFVGKEGNKKETRSVGEGGLSPDGANAL